MPQTIQIDNVVFQSLFSILNTPPFVEFLQGTQYRWDLGNSASKSDPHFLTMNAVSKTPFVALQVLKPEAPGTIHPFQENGRVKAKAGELFAIPGCQILLG